MANYIEKLFKYVWVPAITESYIVNEYVCHEECTTTYSSEYTPEVTEILSSDSLVLEGYTSGEFATDFTLYATTSCVTVCEWKSVTKYYTIPGYYITVIDIGWTAGAHGLLTLDYDHAFYFKPSADAIGIVTGITTSAHNIGYSYQDIDFGFYISKGLYRIIESSTFKTNWQLFNQGDEFSVQYYSDRIVYAINDSVVYTTYVELTDQLLPDISLYASGDRVEDACVSAAYILNATLEGGSSLKASLNLNGFRSMTAVLSGDSTLSASPSVIKGLQAALTSSASIGASLNLNGFKTCTATIECSSTLTAYTDGNAVNMSTGFSALDTISSGGLGNYAESDADMAPMTSLSESGLLAPSLSIANTAMLGMATAMNVLNIEPISMTTEFQHLDSISSEGPYAESITSFENIGSFGGEFPLYTGVLVSDIPGFEVYATGTVDSPNGLTGFTPSLTLEAYTGGQLYSDAPSISLIIEGDIANLGRMDAVVPKIEITAYAYVGYNARAFLKVPGFTVDFIAGAVLKETIPGFSIIGDGLVGSIINSEIIVPRFIIDANITVEDYGVAELIIPGFLSLSGILDEIFGRFTLLATGFTTLDVTLNTQVMNTNNIALTEYINFEFDNIIQINDIYYGVKSDGLYLLDNDTDNAINIDASFETMPTDFGNIQLKNMSYLYVTARTDSLFSVQSAYDEQYSTLYNSANMYRTTPYNWRTQLGRGLKAIYWGSKISNVNGSDFQIQALNNYIHVLKRRR